MEPKNYQIVCPIGTPKEIRGKHDVGDIFINEVECRECGEVIRSNYRHDYKVCKCGKTSVDGGSWYPSISWESGHQPPISKCVLYNDIPVKEEEQDIDSILKKASEGLWTELIETVEPTTIEEDTTKLKDLIMDAGGHSVITIDKKFAVVLLGKLMKNDI